MSNFCFGIKNSSRFFQSDSSLQIVGLASAVRMRKQFSGRPDRMTANVPVRVVPASRAFRHRHVLLVFDKFEITVH
jgi:hypothetical protein